MKRIIIFCLVLMPTVALVFCANKDPQAQLAIQIVKDSPITRLGFGPTIEQYYSSYKDLEWTAEKTTEDVYVVTLIISMRKENYNDNYAEWEVNVKKRDISWPRIGVIKDGKRVHIF
jgi:hypothetical protein